LPFSSVNIFGGFSYIPIRTRVALSAETAMQKTDV
jgi:hypothetical protein